MQELYILCRLYIAFNIQGACLWGRGTQIWFGRGCAAQASKPLPIFKGHFGKKGYALLRIFGLSQKIGPMFKDFFVKNGTHV